MAKNTKIIDSMLHLSNKVVVLEDELCNAFRKYYELRAGEKPADDTVSNYRVYLDKIMDFEADHIYCTGCFHQVWNRENIASGKPVSYPCDSCENGSQFLEKRKKDAESNSQ